MLASKSAQDFVYLMQLPLGLLTPALISPLKAFDNPFPIDIYVKVD